MLSVSDSCLREQKQKLNACLSFSTAVGCEDTGSSEEGGTLFTELFEAHYLFITVD